MDEAAHDEGKQEGEEIGHDDREDSVHDSYDADQQDTSNYISILFMA